MKHKPKYIESENQNRPLVLSPEGTPINGPGNRYMQDQAVREIAKKKLSKITAYTKKVAELYKPKPSEKKKAELEKEYAKIHTVIRETKPTVDYLGHVYEQNV